MGGGERQELQRTHEQRVTELQSQHTTHVAQLTAQWTAERESLQARLKDEEERCSTLRQELMNAVRGAAFNTGAPQSVTHTTQVEMRSPELKQFLESYHHLFSRSTLTFSYAILRLLYFLLCSKWKHRLTHWRCGSIDERKS